jgi:hypothetical protein
LADVSERQGGIGRNGQGSRDGQAHLLRRFLLLRHHAGRDYEQGKHQEYEGGKSFSHRTSLKEFISVSPECRGWISRAVSR